MIERLSMHSMPGTQTPPEALIPRNPLREAVSITPILGMRMLMQKGGWTWSWAVHPEPALRTSHWAPPLPHSLCSSAHSRSLFGRHWLSEWVGNHDFPWATQTLREEPTHHSRFCLPSVFRLRDINLSPREGHPDSFLLPACWQSRLSSLGMPHSVFSSFFEQIEEWEQRQPVRLVCQDERFNFPGGPGSWSRPPRSERGGCEHRHNSQLGS